MTSVVVVVRSSALERRHSKSKCVTKLRMTLSRVVAMAKTTRCNGNVNHGVVFATEPTLVHADAPTQMATDMTMTKCREESHVSCQKPRRHVEQHGKMPSTANTDGMWLLLEEMQQGFKIGNEDEAIHECNAVVCTSHRIASLASIV